MSLSLYGGTSTTRKRSSYSPLRSLQQATQRQAGSGTTTDLQRILGSLAPVKTYDAQSYLSKIQAMPTIAAHGDGTAAAVAANVPLSVSHALPYQVGGFGSQYGDYASDPVLNKIKAMQNAALFGTRSDVQRQQRDLLLNLGSRDLAKSVLGDKDPIYGLVSEDPETSLSTFARIAHDYGQTVHASDEDLNSNNLFYSGYRGKVLGDLARQQTTAKNDAAAQVQAQLGGLTRVLTGAEQDYQNAMMSAESDAYMRAMEAAFAAAGAGGGGGGAPPATDPTQPAPAPTSTATGTTGSGPYDPVTGINYGDILDATRPPNPFDGYTIPTSPYQLPTYGGGGSYLGGF